jgi:hypothetical protein
MPVRRFSGVFFLLVILGVIPFSLSSYACNHGIEPSIGQNDIIQSSKGFSISTICFTWSDYRPNSVVKRSQMIVVG